MQDSGCKMPESCIVVSWVMSFITPSKRGKILKMNEGTLEKTLNWLMYSVFLSLLPIGVSCLLLLTLKQPPSFVGLFSNGELLLITVALTANSIEALRKTDTTRNIPKSIITFNAIAILILASTWFGQIFSYNVDPNRTFGDINTDVVTVGSVVLLALAILNGLVGIRLTEE
jgi:hypothetical protein